MAVADWSPPREAGPSPVSQTPDVPISREERGEFEAQASPSVFQEETVDLPALLHLILQQV